MKLRRNQTSEERLKRLAKEIQILSQKDAERIREAERVAQLRREAAAKLHGICADFVAALNGLLPKPLVDIGPAEYCPDSFRDPGSNVFQINFNGRVIHIEFQATDTPTSTENFRVPYILEGSVRGFNQQMLDRVLIPELSLFCCVEGDRQTWVTFDPRTHRVTPFDQDFLITMMEKLM